MFDDRARVLLILSRDLLDRAHVFAGKATVMYRLPVSLQSVLRALIEEGLKRDGQAALRANVEGQARAGGAWHVGTRVKGSEKFTPADVVSQMA